MMLTLLGKKGKRLNCKIICDLGGQCHLLFGLSLSLRFSLPTLPGCFPGLSAGTVRRSYSLDRGGA